MPIDVAGTVAEGFERVGDAFAAAFDGRPDMGAAVAIRHEGRLVVDLWAGTADRRTGAPWVEETAGVVFSCTKGLLAILAAKLVEDGLLDYNAPVSRYWPEFAAAGKDATTVKDLLAHRAGLTAPEEPLSFHDILDWDGMVGRLQAQHPAWTPGSGHAYHAMTFGWLVGELVRRASGLTVGRYLAETVTRPLGVDAWIGRASCRERVWTVV